jgi:hypothetical protein
LSGESKQMRIMARYKSRPYWGGFIIVYLQEVCAS